MSLANDDLSPPAFLANAPRAPMPRARRWKKLKPRRPEGEKWIDAERWEVTFGADHSFTKPNGHMGGLAAGTRCVWVIEGTKWAALRDAEDYLKLPIAEWRLLQRHGRRVPI